MPTAKILFQPGWKYLAPGPGLDDPVTGEPTTGPGLWIAGTGLVQQPLWTGVEETTTQGVKDERIILFAPENLPVEAIEVTAKDEFLDPQGRCWKATTDGFYRGIPGEPYEYISVRARRAKEKEGK